MLYLIKSLTYTNALKRHKFKLRKIPRRYKLENRFVENKLRNIREKNKKRKSKIKKQNTK